MKTTFAKQVLTAIAVAIVSTSLNAQSSLDKKVLLDIAGDKVTAKEFCDIYAKNNLKNTVVEKKNVDEYLDMFINFRLKVKEATDMKLDTTEHFRKEFEEYRKQLAKPYFSNETISEEIVKEAYDRKHYDIRASHILLLCDKHALPSDTLKIYNKALELRKRALKGEDFGDLAVRYSEDPSAKDIPATETRPAHKGNRGDLGFFTVFDMIYPFETGAYNTKEGEISMPIRTDYGYHIIKVVSKTPALGVTQAAHIFLPVPADTPEEEVAATRQKAENIYKELQKNNGKNWNEAVSQYSEDKGTVNQNGQLSNITVNRIVPEFIETLKSLKPGEISKPVRTNYGFHIIKLLSTTPVNTFEKEKEGLEKRIERDMRSKKSEQVVIEQIRKEYKFKQNDANLEKFMSKVDSSLLKGKYTLPSDLQPTATLFSIGDASYTMGDFVNFINEKIKKPEKAKPQVLAFQLYDAYCDQKTLDYADRHLEEKYPEFKQVLQEYRDGILLFDLMEKQVWNKAAQDTIGLKEFHARHASRYMWGDRVEALVITVAKPEMLDKVKHYMATIPADSMRNTIYSDSTIKRVSVYKTFFQKGENKYVDQTEWKKGVVNEIKSPVDNNIVIVKILDLRAPEQKTLREAKGLVMSDYQTELEEKWVKSLRNKYKFSVDQKVLQKVRNKYK